MPLIIRSRSVFCRDGKQTSRQERKRKPKGTYLKFELNSAPFLSLRPGGVWFSLLNHFPNIPSTQLKQIRHTPFLCRSSWGNILLSVHYRHDCLFAAQPNPLVYSSISKLEEKPFFSNSLTPAPGKPWNSKFVEEGSQLCFRLVFCLSLRGSKLSPDWEWENLGKGEGALGKRSNPCLSYKQSCCHIGTETLSEAEGGVWA